MTKTPRAYQLDGAEWLQHCEERKARGGLITLKPGMGKSLLAILATKMRFEKGQLDACVPVVTTSFARGDWKRELRAWWPEAKVHVLHIDDPTARKQRVKNKEVVWRESDEEWHARKIAQWRETFRSTNVSQPTFLIAGWDAVRELYEAAVEEELLFDTIICDEFHNAKKGARMTSQMIRPLIAKSRLCIGMTGTPVHNRPQDLFNMLSLLAPAKFPSFMRWAERYFMVRVTKGGWGRTVDEFQSESAKRRLHDDIAPYCYDIPSSAIAGLAKRIRYLRTIPARESLLMSPAKLNGLREGSKVDLLLRGMVSHKMKYAVELCTEELPDEPIVVYAFKKAHVAKVAAMLEKAGATVTVAMGAGEDGGTTPKQRDRLIEAWKGGATRILCCTMDAVKESATLTRAAAMVFLDLDWLPGKMMQLEGRIAPERQEEGNRRPARYYYLVVENGPDAVVAETVVEKIEEAQGIVGEVDQTMEEYKKMLQSTQALVEDIDPQEMLDRVLESFEARYERMLEVGLVSASLERD